MSHPFHGYHPQHTERLAAYWAEALGGPPSYTQSLGDETTVVRMHSGNGEHVEMDERAGSVSRSHSTTRDPDDRALRSTLKAFFRWATDRMSTYPESADDVPADLRLPRWSWDGPEHP